MALELLLTTSGSPSTVRVHGRVIVHPVVDLNLLTDVSLLELLSDQKFIDDLGAGDFTLKFKNGTAITDISNAFGEGTFGRLNNPGATTSPVATSDSTKGYAVGSWWINNTTQNIYFCLKSTATAAVWSAGLATGAGTLTESDVQNATATAGTSETSKTYVSLPGNGVGGLVKLTTTGIKTKPYIIVFSGSFSVDPANKSILLRLSIGGSVVFESERELKASSAASPNTLSTNHAVTVSAGVDILIEWRLEGNGNPTGTCNHGTLSIKGVG